MGYKKIFVAQGFLEKEGTDYEEKFVPVMGYNSIRSIRVGMRWEIHPLTSRKNS